jgi:hypothetical protein
MRFLSKIFGSSKNQLIELLEASITQLRVGIFSRLSKKYISAYGKQKADLLSAAILNEALLEEPSNTEGDAFRKNNVLLIEDELKKISTDTIVSQAFSYLYATQTLYLVFITKEPFPKRARELGEQATLLSIYIPNTFDICGSDNVQECVIEIMNYATKFVEESK